MCVKERFLIFAAAGAVFIATLSAAPAQPHAASTVVANVEADGTTPLHRAAQRNDVEAADALIRQGANVKAANRYGVTPLSLACVNGNAAMIDMLLKAGADVNTTLPEGETALMTATNTGSVAALRVLLSRGANVNTKENSRGQTALMWAANGGHTGAAQLLIEAGADINARSNANFSPMTFAVRGGHIDIVRLLLAAGASANATVAGAAVASGVAGRNATENTSLLGLAILNGKYHVAHLLLQNGADPNPPDARGSLLHTLAFMRKSPHPQSVGDSLEIVQELLARGANPNARIAWQEIPWSLDDGETKSPPNISAARQFIIMSGATPYFVAARGGDVPLMRLLIAHGADPRIPNVNGVTPFMAAAGFGWWEGESASPTNGLTSETERLEAVKLALELSGEDVNGVADFGGNIAFDEDGEDLFFAYPRKYSFDPTQKARPETMMGDVRWAGSTALHVAPLTGQESIVRFLVEKGARLDARNKAGWTPLMVTQGMLVASNARFFPKMEALLKELMIERGMDPARYSRRAVSTSAVSQKVLP